MSVILGIVEGLTEFLPVSSTAHLRISEALLHISLTDPFWKMYTIVIQLGAILALLLLFLPRILAYWRTFPHGERGGKTWLTHPLSLTLIAATGYSLLKAVHPSAKDIAKAGADALTPLVMTPEHWIVLIIGMAVSFIVAYVVVGWFLQYVRKHGFAVFAVYRILLGAGLLAWLHTHR